MTRNISGVAALAASARQAMEIVGKNIRTARKRRGWTLEAMAGSMLVTRKTLSRLEAGDSSVGITVLAAALHVLDMTADLQNIASPERDEVGMFYEKQRLPQRVRTKQQPAADKLDF